MSHLTNPLATTEQLLLRASLSTVPQDLQESVFVATQCLTQAAGKLLRAPPAVTAQANVLLARYWLVDSPMAAEFSVRCVALRVTRLVLLLLLTGRAQDVSAAVTYLVGKIGPKPRSPRDVANVYGYLLAPGSALFRSGEPPEDDPKSYYQSETDYLAFSNRIMALEARILYALSFDTHVALPHPLAITYLQTLDFFSRPRSEASSRVVQYLNTALLSPQMLYLTHQPHALAVAAIYNAARDLGAKTPESEWWEVFDVDREELGFLVVAMRSLEAWLRQRKEELPVFRERMLTRRDVEEEMRKRGLPAANGDGEADEEAEIMRRMDARQPGFT
ncbi:cyclin [Purpureocillium lavendulum]|uniref:Cyclin n=1 Tax=Purpureocillium lavendulum TaxID=1247861 RepID=A0AB34G6P8_9HYPO|nr:cyclin [Purpureocillium lavendulum]